MKSLQGHLLIASPSEFDPDFAKAVILVIQHSPEQAVGLVLNRPTGATVKELWKTSVKKSCDCQRPVYSGGPVPGPLMAVHTCESLARIEILPGVYYAVHKKDLDKLVRQSDHAFKVFDSHAGWGPGQLETWLDQRSWSTMPATVQHVFHDQGDLWEEVVDHD